MKTVFYPTKIWKKESPEKHNINEEIIYSLDNKINEEFPHLKSILIVKDDSIIYEKYLNGCSQDTLHEIACMSKSFLSAVIGTALKDKLINDLQTKVVDIFSEDIPEDIDKNFYKITLEHLLTKTSGIKWPGPNYQFPEDQRFNDIRLPFSLKIKDEPGKVFEYKPDPHILIYAIEKLSGIDFVCYADKNLFSPLGIKDYLWNTNFHKNGFLSMRTKDIAKLGYLYLNNGIWDNHQIIASEYIHQSTRGHVYGNFPESSPYGYLWWIDNIENLKAFHAGGFGGQLLYVIPELRLVFVITSSMDRPHQENKLIVKDFVKMIMPE